MPAITSRSHVTIFLGVGCSHHAKPFFCYRSTVHSTLGALYQHVVAAWSTTRFPCRGPYSNKAAKSLPAVGLTACNVVSPRDIIVEHGTHHRHLPNILIDTSSFLTGIAAVKQTTVDTDVGSFSLQIVVQDTLRWIGVSQQLQQVQAHAINSGKRIASIKSALECIHPFCWDIRRLQDRRQGGRGCLVSRAFHSRYRRSFQTDRNYRV